MSDVICGSVGPNVIWPLWETPQEKHLNLSAFSDSLGNLVRAQKLHTISLSSPQPPVGHLSLCDHGSVKKPKMSARTKLITRHLTAGQAGANPGSQSYQPVGICLVFSVFLSYKAMTHSAVVRALLILPVKCSSLVLGTMPVKRRQMSPNNKISSEKDVPGRVTSLRWASGCRVTIPSAPWPVSCHWDR